MLLAISYFIADVLFFLLRIYFLFAIPTLAAVYQDMITLRNHQTEVGQKSSKNQFSSHTYRDSGS